MATITMSQARHNDLVYLTLKHLFFKPTFGPDASPRECDIRICMQMGHPPMFAAAGPLAVILLPDEVSPRRHDVEYQIDTELVFEETVTYLEDHWMKIRFPRSTRRRMHQEYKDIIIDAIMKTPEAKCGESIQSL